MNSNESTARNTMKEILGSRESKNTFYRFYLYFLLKKSIQNKLYTQLVNFPFFLLFSFWKIFSCYLLFFVIFRSNLRRRIKVVIAKLRTIVFFVQLQFCHIN